MSRPVSWPAGLLGLLVAVLCFAHEGEEHGTPAVTPMQPTRHALTAVSKHHELVLKNMPLEPGKQARLDVYLSDFDSNSPISGASVRLSLRAPADGREIWSGMADTTAQAGIYAATFTPSDTGTVNVIVAVQAQGAQDEFALAGVEIGRPARQAGGPTGARGLLPLWIALAVVGSVAILGLVRLGRRGGRAARTLLVAAAVALVSSPAGAHEGHDEAPATSGAALGPGSEVYLAKEAQFLLGVLTQPARLENVANHLHVQGRVAPRTGGDLEVVAPQSGRLYFPAARTPVLGQRVTRGQVVATLVVVDSLDLRSPLGGVVTEVAVVNGQLINAGQKILRVLDPSVVWVHADVYERDLESIEHSHRARIVSPAYPDTVFDGRRVALGASLGEVQGTVEAYFEVSNPRGRLRVGMLVDVDIQQGGSRPALVVPRSAVVEKDGRNLVFVHSAPERFIAREVRQVANLGERIAVQGDIRSGDRVVTSGSYQLLSAPVVSIGS